MTAAASNAVEMKRKQIAKPSYAERPPLELTKGEAYMIWGHPSVKAVDKITEVIDGVKILQGDAAPDWRECEPCLEAKMHKLIRRAPPRNPTTRPFERLSIDIVQLMKRGDQCYNSDI